MADRKYMEETRYSVIVLLNLGQQTDSVNRREMNCAGQQSYYYFILFRFYLLSMYVWFYSCLIM
jgi:hypothetical protein